MEAIGQLGASCLRPRIRPRSSWSEVAALTWNITKLALASTAHGDHLSRGDEHDQAPTEVQCFKISPDLGLVSLNDLRGGCDVALPVDDGIDLPIGAERNSIGNAGRHQLLAAVHREAADRE